MNQDAPRTRTGQARAAMAEALRADFAEVHASISTAIALAEALATESGGVNGVSIWWRGVAQKLAHERKALDQKIEEVVASLTSQKAPAASESSLDEALMERIREARQGQAA
jgi:hypothetical protein